MHRLLVSPGGNQTNCPPQLNPEIGGLGIRVSFYLQTFILACITSLSAGDPDRVSDTEESLFTLALTNVSMCIITFSLGFKADPEITLHDAIVVLYLTLLSSTFILSSTFSRKLYKENWKLACLSIVQYYLFFGLAISIFVKAGDEFGQLPACNTGARIAFFKPYDIFPSGRIAIIVSAGFFAFLYTKFLIEEFLQNDSIYDRNLRPKTTGVGHSGGNQSPGSESEANRTNGPINWQAALKAVLGYLLRVFGSHDRNTTPGERIFDFSVIIIVWALVVINTELVIWYNKFKETEGSPWTFGQILALLLVIIPLKKLIQVLIQEKHISSIFGTEEVEMTVLLKENGDISRNYPEASKKKSV